MLASVHDGDHDSVDRIFAGFPESYTANDSQIGCSSNCRQREGKRAQTPKKTPFLHVV